MKCIEPESIGLSGKRLDRVSAWLEQQVTSERVAGASVMISRYGQPALFECKGLAEVETGKPFAEDTIVRIYSMTKPITTVAAMMLYEEGAFQVDDAVAKYIPEFADLKVWQGGDINAVKPVKTPMSVKHLMTHTSGLTYGFMRANAVDAEYRELIEPHDDMTLEEWAGKLATIPLICEPGAQWNYSVSTDVLGRLVEIWSGQTLEAFFQERIFKPLGMFDTSFDVPEAKQPRFAALYNAASGAALGGTPRNQALVANRETGITLQESASESVYFKPQKFFSGGGGLTSTMQDYARFCEMLLSYGSYAGQDLLSRKTVEFMMCNHLPDNNDMAAMGQPVWSETTYDGIGFGLGGAVVLDPVKAQTITSPGEFHWGGAASTFFWVDPEEDLFVIFLTQLLPSSAYPIRRELRTRVYQTIVD